jgi:hypothetical protein
MLGKKEIRTLVDSGLINLVQGTNDITISVDEAALNTFIEANQKTYSAANIGTGANIYKDSTVVGDNTQLNIRKINASNSGTGANILKPQVENTNDISIIAKSLKSSNSSVTITAGTDDIDLTVTSGTSYSAGTAMSLVGTTFNNIAPDQTVVLTQGGATTITGTYPNFTITSTDNNTTYSAGNGLVLTGTVFSIENLQKVITYPTDFTGTNYTLTNADNNYEIIIDNGATAVTITVPSGLVSKIGIGFTQKGTADITYTTSGTTINTPVGLKIKGQYYQTYLSQELATDSFYLGGNTKI